MAATAVQHGTFFQFESLPLPELDEGVGALDPRAVVGMQINGRIANGTTPLNHASNQVGMGHRQA
jgi:hypothetical protein